MGISWPAWKLCTCGLSLFCSSAEVAKSALSRCRAGHFDPEELELPRGPLTPSTCLFIILTHRGCKNNDRKLKAQLLSFGVPRKNILVKYGYVFGEQEHMGKQVAFNEICHYSFRHRWLPAAHAALQEARTPVRAVIYLENNAVAEFANIKALMDAMRRPRGPEVRWVGWRILHKPNFFSNHHRNPVVEGSKAIGFVRGGLRRAYRACTYTKRYSHLDLMLCRRIAPRHINVCRPSLFGARAHWSVCGSHGGPRVRRSAHRVKQSIMKKR